MMTAPIATPQAVGVASNGGTLAQTSGNMTSVQGGLTVSQSAIATAQQQLNRLQGISQPSLNQSTIMRTQPVQPIPQPAPQPVQPTPQPPAAPSAFAALSADPNRQVPIQITLPPQAGVPDAQQRVLTIHVPASALTGKIMISCGYVNDYVQVFNCGYLSAIFALF